MSTPIRLLVTGIHGRMGKTVLDCAREDARFRITDLPASHDLDFFSAALAHSDVIIDFTHPDATLPFAKASAQAGKPIVIGTTGHPEAVRSALADQAHTIPIVLAPNFSIGVNALFWLTRKATEILGTDFDLEIVEMHHRQKKDAPSGTALRLAEILAEVRSLSIHSELRHGRNGMVGRRSATEIGMHALRGGDVVGDHTVLFAGNGERLELTHKASSRATFARGALQAAIWALEQKPGLYDMQDVLGLRD